jgi:hypothetical protein
MWCSDTTLSRIRSGDFLPVRKKEEEREHNGARAVAREKDRIVIKIIYLI